MLEHWCGKKLKGWKIKHQAIKFWPNIVLIEKNRVLGSHIKYNTDISNVYIAVFNFKY